MEFALLVLADLGRRLGRVEREDLELGGHVVIIEKYCGVNTKLNKVNEQILRPWESVQEMEGLT